MIKLVGVSGFEDIYVEMYKSYVSSLTVFGDKIEIYNDSKIQKTIGRDDENIFIILYNNICAGFLTLGLNENTFSANDIYIQEFFVKDEFRRYGIGFNTIKLLTKKYKNKDFSAFILHNNFIAKNFWNKTFSKLNYKIGFSSCFAVDNLDFYYWMK